MDFHSAPRSSGTRDQERRETTIVGVVDDVKQDAGWGAAARVVHRLRAGAQIPTIRRRSSCADRDDPSAQIDTLRTALREEDPALALDAVMTMDQRVGRSVARQRTYAVLLGGFALFAC